MLYLPNDEIFVNAFIHCEVPTKAQIFSRTGQRAVTPNGVFTQDKSYQFGKTNTQSAMEFVSDAEHFESSKDETSKDE